MRFGTITIISNNSDTFWYWTNKLQVRFIQSQRWRCPDSVEIINITKFQFYQSKAIQLHHLISSLSELLKMWNLSFLTQSVYDYPVCEGVLNSSSISRQYCLTTQVASNKLDSPYKFVIYKSSLSFIIESDQWFKHNLEINIPNLPIQSNCGCFISTRVKTISFPQNDLSPMHYGNLNIIVRMVFNCPITARRSVLNENLNLIKQEPINIVIIIPFKNNENYQHTLTNRDDISSRLLQIAIYFSCNNDFVWSTIPF